MNTVLSYSHGRFIPVADAIVMVVAHRGCLVMPLLNYSEKLVKGCCFMDVKPKLDQETLHVAEFRV